MRPLILKPICSTAGVHMADRAFFAAYPIRSFLARPFFAEDTVLPPWVSIFAEDERGELAEVNLVVVKNLGAARLRWLFAAHKRPLLPDDVSIVRFLRFREIDADVPKVWWK